MMKLVVEYFTRALGEQTRFQTGGDEFLGLPHPRGVGDEVLRHAVGDVEVVLDPAGHVQQGLDRDIGDLRMVGGEVGKQFTDGVVESDRSSSIICMTIAAVYVLVMLPMRKWSSIVAGWPSAASPCAVR